MAVVRRPSRFRFLVGFLVLVSLTLITLDASGKGSSTLRGLRSGFSSVLSPVQSGIHDALRPVGNFFTGAVDYGHLQAENTRLRDEIAQLRTAQAASAYAQQQADELLHQANLPFAHGIKQVPAEVIDVGSSNFASAVTIDKGTSSGVEVGEPVVAAGGLAGTVAQATSHTATVTLITDPTFVVGVTLPDGNTGSAKGQGAGNRLTVTVLPSNAPTPNVKVGQTLSTSGLSMENYPPGIPVGRVVSAKVPPGETEPAISLRPLVNAAALQYVQVLLWSPQTPGSR
ncbi:MAG TPA: rod shape-determining protein MreC [Acidimicrobiales bacterium]|nr:rod shape-determining protein MreC [Acidimicrobiales bacterium]